MRQIKIILVAVSLVMVFPFVSSAQSSCVQNLREARNFYDAGKLNELPKLLLKCIDNGFSKEEKVDALRLVTLSYLFDEEEEKAEDSYLRLLKLEPEYQVDEDSDPMELVILSDRFDTEAKFFYGLKLSTAYNIIQSQPQYPSENLLPGTYNAPISVGIGMFFRYPFTKEISANIEAYYIFRNTVLVRPTREPEGDTGADQLVTRVDQFLDVPLLGNYKLPIANSFELEATGGPMLNYLLSSSLTVEGAGLSINNLDMLPYRNRFHLSGVLGLRASFKQLGVNFITVETLFQYKFSDVFKGPLEEELQFNLANASYQDGPFKGHALWLRVGVKFPYFKPKLKE